MEEEGVVGHLRMDPRHGPDVGEGVLRPRAPAPEREPAEIGGGLRMLPEPGAGPGGQQRPLLALPHVGRDEVEDREHPGRVPVHELLQREEGRVVVPRQGRGPGVGFQGVETALGLHHLRGEGEDGLRGPRVGGDGAEDDLRGLGRALLAQHPLGEEDREADGDLARLLQGRHEPEGEGRHGALAPEQLLEEPDTGVGVVAAEVHDEVRGLRLLPEEHAHGHQGAEGSRNFPAAALHRLQEALREGEVGPPSRARHLHDPGDRLLPVALLPGEERKAGERRAAVPAPREEGPALVAERLHGRIPPGGDPVHDLRGPVQFLPLGVDAPRLEPDPLRLRRRRLQLLEHRQERGGAARLALEGGQHVGHGALGVLQRAEDLGAQQQEVGVVGLQGDRPLGGRQGARGLSLGEPLPRVRRPVRRFLPPEEAQEPVEHAHGEQYRGTGAASEGLRCAPPGRKGSSVAGARRGEAPGLEQVDELLG